MHWISKALATNNLAIKIFLQFQFYRWQKRGSPVNYNIQLTNNFSSGRKLKTSHWELVYKNWLISYQLPILHAEHFPRTSLFDNSIGVSAFFIFHGKLPKDLRLLQRPHGLDICIMRTGTISKLRFIVKIVFVFDAVFVWRHQRIGIYWEDFLCLCICLWLVFVAMAWISARWELAPREN